VGREDVSQVFVNTRFGYVTKDIVVVLAILDGVKFGPSPCNGRMGIGCESVIGGVPYDLGDWQQLLQHLVSGEMRFGVARCVEGSTSRVPRQRRAIWIRRNHRSDESPRLAI
jgi:hypothetical protein